MVFPAPTRQGTVASRATKQPLFSRISISNRRRITSILLAVAIFVVLAGLTSMAQGRRPVIFSILNAIFVGTSVGLFEEFYVQSYRGRWMRSIHPLRSILIYSAIVSLIFVGATNLTHFLLSGIYDFPVPYGRLPVLLPIVLMFSVIGIAVMRSVHFIGAKTLFHLMVGTYHRPVLQEKVLVFLDINDSTGLAEQLGPLQTKSLVGKFLFDVSKPITDYGGDIYLYKGDGLIAVWEWRDAIGGSLILKALDAVAATIRRELRVFRQQFGVVPSFRIGVHGGEVVVSEQGDTKRAIGIYGSTINIAARMEEAAKTHNIVCAISGDVAQELSDPENRLSLIGYEKIKGIATEMAIFEYRC
ncbi:MAG TPA: adenylate/guanylate cyclase domain-containing protein [Stellaceae bacterium]|jgi:class 3 adenylate cyclase|nr:adenylate/guanylate cyclase domain-containing protein [Stellaceae bacterium]